MYSSNFLGISESEKNLCISSMGDANFQILSGLRSLLAFRDSRSARLAFAVSCCSSRSAEEGRDETNAQYWMEVM